MYVNDAFGAAHRAHASTAGVAAHVKHAVAGLLMQKELDYLYGALGDPATVKRPFVAIVGGSKVLALALALALTLTLTLTLTPGLPQGLVQDRRDQRAAREGGQGLPLTPNPSPNPNPYPYP